MEITRYDGNGNELRPGLRSRHRHNSENLKFEIYTVLDAVGPDSWHAEVELFHEVIIHVPDPFPDHIAALRAAEAALRQRAIEVFREPR
ncbi:hypothetical protein [Microbacterium sp. GCS4]|uniref:hypothetical protein n=1 Tax=Microbacterium sp. GCS4 TaxID=1692239 RepID=UPI000681246F|nr:hypothetical protein [Microbacterium sp. GCS4]KNY07755.1 hypothetical protein AKH00_05855 [Microbacterium sp. GCS4]